MGFLKNYFTELKNEAMEAYKKGYEEALDFELHEKAEKIREDRRKRQKINDYELQEPQNVEDEESEEVTLSIISIGENRSMITQILQEVTDWELEYIESFLDDMPNVIHGPEKDISYVQEKLQEFGADSYIVEDDELVFLKISSIGKNKAEAMKIFESEFGIADEQELELPDYFKGPIERMEKIYRELKSTGVMVEIMGLEEYLEEIGEDEVEMEAECILHIMDTGVNEVAFIRIIRECADFTGLAEVKDFVDNLPQDLYGSMEVLKDIKARLDEIGVKSEINCGEKKMPKVVYCSACGIQMPSDARFCMNCGAKRKE